MFESRIAALAPAQRAFLASRLAALQDTLPDEHWTTGDQLVAHVVRRNGAPVSASELRTFLEASLPDYMIPNTFNFMAQLPATPNGKVDRRALSTMAPLPPEARNVYVAPRSDLERMLCTILADVLDRPHVGVKDDFFEIGGHSLHAIRVVSKIREYLQIEFPLPLLFSLRTAEKLAEHCLTLEHDRDRITAAATLYMEVAELSETEVDARLAEQGDAGDPPT